MRELLTLFPPSVAVVSYEVAVLLQLRIVVCRQHLAVGVHVDACVLGLFEEIGNIMEIVAADEYTRTLAHADVHLRHLRFAVSTGIGLIEECHHVDTIFTGSEEELEQVVACSIGIGDAGESLDHESSDRCVALSEACSMLVVSGHTLESQDDSLLQCPRWLCGARSRGRPQR